MVKTYLMAVLISASLAVCAQSPKRDTIQGYIGTGDGFYVVRDKVSLMVYNQNNNHPISRIPIQEKDSTSIEFSNYILIINDKFYYFYNKYGDFIYYQTIDE